MAIRRKPAAPGVAADHCRAGDLLKFHVVAAWLLLGFIPVFDSEPIKIRISASGFCRIIKQAKTIPHEVRDRVGHFQCVSNRIPHFPIQAIQEFGLVFQIGKITIDP